MTEPQKLWIRALRSGEYKQGSSFLKTIHGHCCLGVACEVAIQGGIHINVKSEEHYFRFGGHTGAVPDIVKEWIGLKESQGQFGPQDHQTLAAMNDDGKTFAEIADFIEANPEKVFVNEPEHQVS